MSRIILPHDSLGETIAYVKALTGLQNVTVPNPPSNNDLGQVLKVFSKYVSVSSSANIGFGFGSIDGDSDIKVIVQDYWWLKEVTDASDKINSWTFAIGFRVGIKIVGFSARLDIGLGSLAAKAETEGLNSQIQILRVGMPQGPDVPVDLAVPVNLDVDKFGELKSWQGQVLSYVKANRAQLSPVPVSASINVDSDKLLNETPGVRYAMWRIYKGTTLKSAIAYLERGTLSEVSQSIVRSVFANIFQNPTMIIPGNPSENIVPSKTEKNIAEEWLMGYQKLP